MKPTAQPQLEAIAARPVCAARHADRDGVYTCTLLAHGAEIKHVCSKGKSW